MASLTLGIDLLDPTLQEISGANSFELELGRESFIRLWNDYNFKVKTYQETEVTQGTTDSREDMVSQRLLSGRRWNPSIDLTRHVVSQARIQLPRKPSGAS